MRAMNLGSIGEIPPRTRGMCGFTSATASAAAIAMSANIRHSGSISKSQWDLLFGSFQIITASTIPPPSLAHAHTRAHLETTPDSTHRRRGTDLNRSSSFVIVPSNRNVDRARATGQCLTTTDEHFGLRMLENFESSAPQHRFDAGAIWNPPIGRIARITFFDEKHFWKAR